MKKYLLMIMALIAMAFSFTSCGSDDDDNGSGSTTTGVVEEGNKLYLKGTTSYQGWQRIEIITFYFDESGKCTQGVRTLQSSNKQDLEETYNEMKEEFDPEDLSYNGSVITLIIHDFDGSSKESIRQYLEELSAQANK